MYKLIKWLINYIINATQPSFAYYGFIVAMNKETNVFNWPWYLEACLYTVLAVNLFVIIANIISKKDVRNLS